MLNKFSCWTNVQIGQSYEWVRPWDPPTARMLEKPPAHSSYDLPRHHLVNRDTQDNENPVYKVEIDYNFQEIKRDSGAINIRVDYTNLLNYCEDVTGTPATRRKKRSTTSARDEHISYHEWRGKGQWAQTSHKALRKRQADIIQQSKVNHTLLE
ncbi:hypothetical protein N7486_001245 [Penicillium sp. IBT 16267x]|nr:hypothetical protein N7486_001245 [Penicillium sp. IBT 16267x]